MGSASFHSFTDNPFFRAIDFEALERKEIEPVFVPSSEKTNFDATYDLEELLLEEAPLEARARRQKPRELLKEDATEKEIREDELYKLIEKDFISFNYTSAAYDRYASLLFSKLTTDLSCRFVGSTDPNAPNAGAPGDWMQPPPMPHDQESIGRAISGGKQPSSRKRAKSQASTPSGSPTSVSSQPPPLPSGHHAPMSRAPTRESNPSVPLSPYQPSYNRLQRPTGTRKESQGGGMQVVLGGEGSWSDLAKNDTTLPADAKLEVTPKPSGGGMLSFLGRKKGRGHSPKPQERGILGKEGARVVISSGE